MGTQGPLVHIEAATLAGGDNNQDRYGYGDGWAFVLDGATSFSETPPVHDGGWYAERLKNALANYLTNEDTTDTASIVAQAIEDAAVDHDVSTQGPCPTSTIALARWNDEQVELYVLGDSFAVAITPTGEATVLTDDRIKQFGDEYRQTTRQRLSEGSGFDKEHRQFLNALQAEQERHRNIPEGYWIAGDYPAAAEYAHRIKLMKQDVNAVLLASDGIATLASPTWPKFTRRTTCEPSQQLKYLHWLECGDPRGLSNPRSKKHDDKTLVKVLFYSNLTRLPKGRGDYILESSRPAS